MFDLCLWFLGLRSPSLQSKYFTDGAISWAWLFFLKNKYLFYLSFAEEFQGNEGLLNIKTFYGLVWRQKPCHNRADGIITHEYFLVIFNCFRDKI